jgi:hypothetical protein
VTLAELQAYVGCPQVRSTYYLEHRDGLDVTAWGARLGGRAGWWVAVTVPAGDGHEFVAAVAWVSGGAKSRDEEVIHLVGRVLAKHAKPTEGEAH